MRKVYEETSWALKKQADWGRQEKEEKEEKTNQRTMGSRKVEGTARIKAQMGTPQEGPWPGWDAEKGRRVSIYSILNPKKSVTDSKPREVQTKASDQGKYFGKISLSKIELPSKKLHRKPSKCGSENRKSKRSKTGWGWATREARKTKRL